MGFAGELVQKMEDFFGKNVILMSSLLTELADSAGDIQFGELQEVELKGLTGVNLVYPVRWE